METDENGAGKRPYFDARTAFDGWGWDDPEIANALQEVIFGPAVGASAIAPLLPQLISDPDGMPGKAVGASALE